MPDFDKIVPLCELYGISADELLMMEKKEKNMKTEELEEIPQINKKIAEDKTGSSL